MEKYLKISTRFGDFFVEHNPNYDYGFESRREVFLIYKKVKFLGFDKYKNVRIVSKKELESYLLKNGIRLDRDSIEFLVKLAEHAVNIYINEESANNLTKRQKEYFERQCK